MAKNVCVERSIVLLNQQYINNIATTSSVVFHVISCNDANIIVTSSWQRWRFKSPAPLLFTQLFIQAQIKVNIKIPRQWPSCGEFTGDRWNPAKWPAMRKMFPFDGVIMKKFRRSTRWSHKVFNSLDLNYNVWYNLKLLTTANSYEPEGVSNHQLHDCLLNRLFMHSSKKTSRLRVTGLCAGNSPVTSEHPAHRASNTENVFIWWRHHRYFALHCVVVRISPTSKTIHW